MVWGSPGKPSFPRRHGKCSDDGCGPCAVIVPSNPSTPTTRTFAVTVFPHVAVTVLKSVVFDDAVLNTTTIISVPESAVCVPFKAQIGLPEGHACRKDWGNALKLTVAP